MFHADTVLGVSKLKQYTRPLVITHLVATCFMVGLIWTIHLLHYPLFAYVGNETYIEFQQEHVDRIGMLLFIPWLTEGITLLGILALAFLGSRRDLVLPSVINGAAMSVVLVISGFWSAPAHGELSDGFDAAVHDRLMNANLVRTLAWTVCGISAVWILLRVWSTNNSDREATRS